MIPERLVRFRARTILSILGIVVSVAILLQLVWLARQVLTWVVIALFLSLALNPAVETFMRRGVPRRGLAVGLTLILTLLGIAAIGALFVPTLVTEVQDFSDALPGYVEDITEGRGRFGFLQEEYGIVDRLRTAIEEQSTSGIIGFSGTAVAVARGVVTAVVATVTIFFLTFFMLLEGPVWVERFFGLFPDDVQPRMRRVGSRIYRTIGGYVTGNLLISVIAGVTSTLVLLVLGVPYAVALGLLVALLDLVPLAGATLAAVIVTSVAFFESVPTGIIVLIFFVVYQQAENHLIQPLVYSRTVQLSPLAILIAVLIGAKLAGVLGALAAIPVAGTLQVILLEWLQVRRERADPEPEPL